MSTYASGDAGIQGESQSEITASRKKLRLARLRLSPARPKDFKVALGATSIG